MTLSRRIAQLEANASPDTFHVLHWWEDREPEPDTSDLEGHIVIIRHFGEKPEEKANVEETN